MKAQNNTQKTVKNQVRKMVLVGLALVFMLVLNSWSVKALNLKEQFLPTYNYSKMAMFKNKQLSESKTMDLANPAIIAEVKRPFNSSKPNIMGDPEVELEIEIKIESTLQIEEYNAREFVNLELDDEIQNWMNSTIETTMEVVDAALTLQIKEYNAREFVDLELDNEIQNWMNSTIKTTMEVVDAESEFQIQGYNANEFVDAEIALEIENWMTNKSIIITIFK